MDRSDGYHHPDYASSLKEFGEAFELKQCGGWIIKRPIPGFPFLDGIGCYPLFSCRDWKLVHLDLDNLKNDLITVSLVTDPFANIEPHDLKKSFDIVHPFKNHYIIDLSEEWENKIDRRHKQKVRKALKEVKIEICSDPAFYLDDWMRLYGSLIQRHKITGIKAFSRECFQEQLAIPGMVLILGKMDGEVVSANMVLMRNQIAYGHLAASSLKGYQVNAAYSIFWATFKYLAEQGIKYFDLGAAAGLKSQARDGLDQFKRGWTKNKQIVYFCGRIFNPEVYGEICKKKGIVETEYFPAYRMGEFS